MVEDRGIVQRGRAMSKSKELSVTAIVDGFVGEVAGHNVASGLDAETKARLTGAHGEFPILVIRDQSLDTDAFMAFGKIFGAFEIDRHLPQF